MIFEFCVRESLQQFFDRVHPERILLNRILCVTDDVMYSYEGKSFSDLNMLEVQLMELFKLFDSSQPEHEELAANESAAYKNLKDAVDLVARINKYVSETAIFEKTRDLFMECKAGCYCFATERNIHNLTTLILLFMALRTTCKMLVLDAKCGSIRSEAYIAYNRQH